jgi:ribosome maturation factor RimP
MDIKKISGEISAKLAPTVEGLGCELVDVEIKKLYGSLNLTVVIFKKSGVSLDDCEIVHKAIDPILDEINPTGEEAYVLNVSSMGLDRPLVTADDFRRRNGEEIQISLFAPIEKTKTHIGTLISVR